MASPSVQNPPTPTESKTSRKKKAKVVRTESPAPPASTKASSVTAGDHQEELSENSYIREIQKNIRNVSKKISNLSRLGELIAEHPDKSLDELVSLKIINADQKASQLKKPALLSQLAQLEEQLALHKKIDQDTRTRITEVEKTLTDKFEKEKAELASQIKEKAEQEAKETLHSNLLILSQFLRLAAARRAEEIDSQADENMALEGVLLHIYSGDEHAVSTMLKLVEGAEEPTHDTAGQVLETTYAQVKQASIANAAAPLAGEAVEAAEPTTETETTEPEVEAAEAKEDPSVANAGLTEIDDGSAVALTNGHAPETSATETVSSNADVADSAANAAAQSQQWDATTTPNDLSMSQEWVDVKIPRENSEVEKEPTASQSWADDHPETSETPVAAATEGNDGFHQVQRNRGNREGSFRGGRGDRGGYRGRGGRGGEGRGRGRGGQRGGMPSRPRRGGDEGQ